MVHKEPAWGFWIPVTNKSSAEYAAKMSGLPVFLLGLSFIWVGISQLLLVRAPIVLAISLATLLCGIFFVFSGLQIRKLKFRTLPFTVGLWMVLNAAAIYISGIGISTVLTLLIGLMAACGLRGWYWLRKHKAT